MGTDRARVAILLTYGLSVRYLVSTGLLRQLAEVVEPVVALEWDDAELVAELERCGASVTRLPDPVYDHALLRVDRLLEIDFERALASPTTAITRRWRRRVLPPGVRAIRQVREFRDRQLVRTGAQRRRRAVEAATLMQTATNIDAYGSWLEEQRIEAVLSLTPYHRSDRIMLAAARGSGRRSISSIISFDNPTTRGRLPVLSDSILVWNRYNQQELERAYPDLADGRTKIVGAPQFDLHVDRSHVLPEAAWREEVGLSPDRPVILFGAGPRVLFPRELELVRAIDRSIDEGRIPGDPQVLLRPHPADSDAVWDGVEQLRNVVRVRGWGKGDGGRAWPSAHDVDLQMSTLAHAAVHVSICSTMVLDGAAFDRPLVAPTFVPGSRAEHAHVRRFYRQEHWQPIARSGAVAQPDSMAELEAAVADGLAHPGRLAPQRRAMLRDLITFDDGASAGRVVREVERLVR